LLSPLLEPSLLFFLLSVRSLLGAVAVTPPKKKKKTSSRVFKVSIFQLRHIPFFTWFVYLVLIG